MSKDRFFKKELSPFITPAMGSHGGAVAEGQIKVLAGLAITEDSRQLGASHLHQFDLAEVIVPATERVMEHVNVLGGVAVTENYLHETYNLKLVGKEYFVELDEELLIQVKDLLPRIPVDKLDILIVERMGKEISGAGMDPNVIGFWRRDGGERKPDYKTIVILDLTDVSHGNAVGIGNAELTTHRMLDKVDIKTTPTNSLASGRPQTSRLPIALDNDMEAIETAFRLYPDPAKVRLARIIDTCALSKFWVSKPLLEELNNQENISIDHKPLELVFDRGKRLEPFSL